MVLAAKANGATRCALKRKAVVGEGEEEGAEEEEAAAAAEGGEGDGKGKGKQKKKKPFQGGRDCTGRRLLANHEVVKGLVQEMQQGWRAEREEMGKKDAEREKREAERDERDAAMDSKLLELLGKIVEVQEEELKVEKKKLHLQEQQLAQSLPKGGVGTEGEEQAHEKAE